MNRLQMCLWIAWSQFVFRIQLPVLWLLLVGLELLRALDTFCRNMTEHTAVAICAFIKGRML